MRLYARSGRQLLLQILGDLGLVIWVFLWLFVAWITHDAVLQFTVPVENAGGTLGVLSVGLNAAAIAVGTTPIAGDALRVPFEQLAGGMGDAHEQADLMAVLIDQAAVVLTVVVFAVPVVAYLVKWLPARVTFIWRSREYGKFLLCGAGAEFFALRAIATAPLADLAKITRDPMGAWKSGDPVLIDRLAQVELNRAGHRLPAQPSSRRRG